MAKVGPLRSVGDDDEDLEPAPLIRMSAEETFDGQERRCPGQPTTSRSALQGTLLPAATQPRARRLPRAPGRPRHRDHDHRGRAVRHRHLGARRRRLPMPDRR